METNSPAASINTKSVPIPRILTLEKRLTIILAQDEDTYCAFCPELDLVTAMPQAEEALEDLIEAMKDYADEYLGEIELYGKSPNRAHHLPYIKAIASCKNDWEIKMMLEVQYGLVHV